MYDRDTRSLWSQITGEAIAGPAEGRKLEELPSQLTTWADWKTAHPDSLVLKKPKLRESAYVDYHSDRNRIGVLGSENPDPRLGAKNLVYGIEIGADALAVPVEAVARSPVSNFELFGVEVVVMSPPSEFGVMGYRRQVDGSALDFEQIPGATFQVRDRQTGSLWAWETGECVQGPLAGQRLQPLDGLVVYWGVWARYHPETKLVGVPAGR
jgi:hypothetical protein